MKLTTKQSTLSKHLSIVSRAIPSRPSHPILVNLLLVADESGKVTLTGFDLSLGLRTQFLAEAEEPGSICLSAKLLSDIVGKLPDGEITLGSEDSHQISITSATGKYTVQGMEPEGYPELPGIVDGESVDLPADILLKGIQGTLFSAGTDETRQVLTGVHLLSGPDYFEIVGCDGHRLSIVENLTPEGSPEFSMTVPSKAMHELQRMLTGAETVSLQFDQGQLICEVGDQRLTSRLLEGQYPNYRRLVPNQFSRQATIERRALISALERVAILADQKNNNIVKFELVQQQLTVSAEAADLGSGRETIPVQFAGEDIALAFNVKYVLEGLKSLSCSEVTLYLNTPTSPVVFRPLSGDKVTLLVMPVQIRK